MKSVSNLFYLALICFFLFKNYVACCLELSGCFILKFIITGIFVTTYILLQFSEQNGALRNTVASTVQLSFFSLYNKTYKE